MAATGLRADSLSFAESLVMGVAGSAPGFSIAVATATLVGAAGHLAPGALILFAAPMLGIAVAYKGLGASMADAGAAYQWTTRIFNRTLGYVSGWALLVASLVFMVTGSVPLGAATLSFLPDPRLADNVLLTTSVGALWFVAVALVLIASIGLTSRVQMAMSLLELAILTLVLAAAFVHALRAGAVNPFSWSWFGLGYDPPTFAASALVVVFFYWGWDVTSNLGEETRDAATTAGDGGYISIICTVLYFVAFTVAAFFLFTVREIGRLGDNIVYRMALEAGLGPAGGRAAAFAVILSSIATLETTMLQFSRTLFAMGRDGAMPSVFGAVRSRTGTPVRAMSLLLGVGLVLIFAASFAPSVGQILADSVRAIAIQVCTYYGLAGLACAWLYRGERRGGRRFWLYVAYPGLSALALIGLGLYAFWTFDTPSRLVGIGGLALGLLFYRPSGYRPTPPSSAQS